MVTYKELIKTQLDLLKKMGKDRRTIEQELGYSAHYIDQVLAKGGNQSFLDLIVEYKDRLELGFDDFKAKTINIAASQQATIELLTRRLDKALGKIEELENKIANQDQGKQHRRSA